MRNLLLVARHEYRRVVVRRGFLLGTLAVPLAMALLIGLVIVIEEMGQNNLPLGYVDQAGLLDATRQDILSDAGEGVEIRAFPDEASARAALEREEIQAFFVLPPDYLDTLHTALYYPTEPPSEDVWSQFNDFVRLNLVAGLPEEIRNRVLQGPEVTVKDIASGREFSESNMILPFAASFFFMIATMSAGGYMMQVTADEKENRTMEVMVTSITPGQLIGGKAVGLLASTLTQLAVYAVAIIVALKVAAPFVRELQAITVPWDYLGLMTLFFLPALGLVCTVMLALGAAVTEVDQGQQISSILSLIFLVPLFVTTVIMENPAHPAVVFLTLFPTSAFMTISLRWGFGTIPTWQLGLSWVLLLATTLLVVWVAARIFRAGMLRYGQPLNLRAAVQAVRRG